MRRFGTLALATALCGCDLVLGIPDVQPLPPATSTATSGSQGGGNGANGGAGASGGAGGDAGGAGGSQPAMCGDDVPVSGELCFGTPSEIPSDGTGPSALLLHDCNDDAVLDVVVPHPASDELIIFVNNGNGGLAGAAPIAVAYSPRRVAATDIDQLGELDLVVTLGVSQHQGYTTLTHSGACTFVAQSPIFRSEEAFTDSVVVDVQGDQPFDLVGTVKNQNSVVAWSLDAGTPFLDLPQAASNPKGMAQGDLDGDLDQDVLVAEDGNRLVRLYERDSGTLTSMGSVTTSPERPQLVATGKLDDGDDLDLVTATAEPAVVTFLNGGAGVLGPRPKSVVTLEADRQPAQPTALAVGDLDGDGDDDVAVTGTTGANAPGHLFLLLNDGTGQLSQALLITVDKQPSAVAIGRLDGDAVADLVLAHTGTGNDKLTVILADP